MATSRHIVHRKVAATYVEKLAARAASVPVGDPFRKPVAIGPLINEKQLNRVRGIVSDSVAAVAKVVTGLFYKPTVLADLGMETRTFQEEIFGPVAPVTIGEDGNHAVALGNATGLRPCRPALRTAASALPERSKLAWSTSMIKP